MCADILQVIKRVYVVHSLYKRVNNNMWHEGRIYRTNENDTRSSFRLDENGDDNLEKIWCFLENVRDPNVSSQDPQLVLADPDPAINC